MPPYGGNPRDPRVTGEMIHAYLQTYAEGHDLLRRTRFNTKLLVATGVTSIPYTPDFESLEHDPGIPIIHSRDVGMAFASLQDKGAEHFVVVGAAKSAYDVVYLLLSQQKRLFQRTPLGRWLGGLFWAFLDFVSGVHAGYNYGDHVRVSRPEIDRQRCIHSFRQVEAQVANILQRLLGGLGVVTLPDFWPTLYSKSLTIRRDQISFIRDRGVHLKSGSELAGHFGIFDATQKNLVGLPAYSKTNLARDSSPKTKPDGDGGLDWASYDPAASPAVDEYLARRSEAGPRSSPKGHVKPF
ncbi:hypothetical protein B2J93_4562 [Marssonina coronariae]|uniref:Uncharacterized protein n=1 Tax=Diplocarpon coronariae TaxID=2795749 RepID=A0A218Z7N5_9HELO|nr:hypothetical protein B2J93_4562 [Marssonina coronariae]